MAFIPKDAQWYLASVVLEHTIGGDPRNVVHVNRHLIAANSPERAYRKARALGRAAEQIYTNTDGRRVRVRFRGLSELTVILDELADGAEISYSEWVGVPEEELRTWAAPKRELSVFAPRRAKTDGPNYMPRSIMRDLEAYGFTQADVEGPD